MGLNLLFLAGGRRVKLLRLFKSVITKHDKIYTTDTELMPATRFVADKVFLVPLCSNEKEFVTCVANICNEHNISAIIPLIAPTVRAIIPLCQRVNTFIISGSDETIRICTDKALTQDFFAEQGVNFPQTIGSPQVSDLPLVARPRFGEGSRGVYFMTNPQEFRAYSLLTADSEYIYTRFIKGDEYSIDCYKDLSGDVVSVVPRQRLRIRAGEVEKSVTRKNSRIQEESYHLLNNLEFIGPATLQCIVAHGVPYFTEINLRYGGGVTLSFKAGAPSYSWLIKELKDVIKPVFSSFQADLSVVRYDEEFIFHENIYSSIKSTK